MTRTLALIIYAALIAFTPFPLTYIVAQCLRPFVDILPGIANDAAPLLWAEAVEQWWLFAIGLALIVYGIANWNDDEQNT